MKKGLFPLISWPSLIFAGLLCGCTQGQPTIEALTSLPAISLSKTSFAAKNVRAYAFNLSGTCGAGVNSFEISTDAGISYHSIGSLGGTMTQDCSGAGTFSILITGFGDHVSNITNLSNGESRNILVRGTSAFGTTEPQTVVFTSLSSAYTTKGFLWAQDHSVSKNTVSGYSMNNNHTFATRTSSGYTVKGALK